MSESRGQFYWLGIGLGEAGQAANTAEWESLKTWLFGVAGVGGVALVIDLAG